MNFKSFFAATLLIFGFTTQAKVLIITHAFNRPDFIEIQHKTFKKFLKDDYEFVVFNDAERNPDASRIITNMCERLGLRCINIPQEIHDRPYLKRFPHENDYNSPCIRCANVVQYSLDVLGFNHDGIVMIIDADMFLIKEFSVEQSLNGYDIAGVPQFRGNRGSIMYIWNGLVFFNMNTLPNKKMIDFNCGIVDGYSVDVGGQTHHYLKQHPTVKYLQIVASHFTSIKSNHDMINLLQTSKNTTNQKIAQLLKSNINNIEFLVDYSFLHYRGGGNWDNKSPNYHKYKTTMLNRFIRSILDAS